MSKRDEMADALICLFIALAVCLFTWKFGLWLLGLLRAL